MKWYIGIFSKFWFLRRLSAKCFGWKWGKKGYYEDYDEKLTDVNKTKTSK